MENPSNAKKLQQEIARRLKFVRFKRLNDEFVCVMLSLSRFHDGSNPDLKDYHREIFTLRNVIGTDEIEFHPGSIAVVNFMGNTMFDEANFCIEERDAALINVNAVVHVMLHEFMTKVVIPTERGEIDPAELVALIEAEAA